MIVRVVGAGSWGTAIALLLGRRGVPVVLVGREGDDLETLQARRENLRYLPGFPLPHCVEVRSFTQGEVEAESITVLAVPSSAVAQVIPMIPGPELSQTRGVVIASKGLDPVSQSVLSEHPSLAADRVAVLSGPNLAREVAQGIPTVAVVASSDAQLAAHLRDLFASRSFRVYSSTDVRGVELAGALKNVYAIGGGMSDGLGYGDNTKGALLARGLNEMARLGVAMGGRLETFLGIAGVGDLFATACSELSRNYRVGKMVAEGRPLSAVLTDLGQVAEGVSTAKVAVALGHKHNTEMPICQAIDAVLNGMMPAQRAVQELMEREPKSEGDGLTVSRA